MISELTMFVFQRSLSLRRRDNSWDRKWEETQRPELEAGNTRGRATAWAR